MHYRGMSRTSEKKWDRVGTSENKISKMVASLLVKIHMVVERRKMIARGFQLENRKQIKPFQVCAQLAQGLFFRRRRAPEI
jgi:hypothetical protein